MGLGGYQHRGVRGYQHRGVRGYQHRGVRGYQHTGVRGYQHTGVRGYQHTGVRGDISIEGLGGYQHTGVRGYQYRGVGVPALRGSTVVLTSNVCVSWAFPSPCGGAYCNGGSICTLKWCPEVRSCDRSE